jgi:Rps23 Pro-64 3,4-dihydroxylase Tpa1-like proline 4-hydroxylase
MSTPLPLTIKNYNMLLPREQLMAIAEQKAETYQNASPFPHIVLDNLFPEDILDQVLEEFPDPNDPNWHRFKNDKEIKLASKGDDVLGPYTRAMIHNLNSGTFLKFLEKLTGIQGLLPDPHLAGGGMHRILPGGKLAIHADFNKHDDFNLDRRLNVLLYLNRDWEESFGGHFELWKEDMSEAEVKVLPLFNRMAIFTTTSTSWHGHPNPLTCPEGRSRRSLALYYYTVGRPEHEQREAHSTIFKSRPGEKLTPDVSTSDRVKSVIKEFIPPVLLRLKPGHKPSEK